MPHSQRAPLANTVCIRFVVLSELKMVAWQRVQDPRSHASHECPAHG